MEHDTKRKKKTQRQKKAGEKKFLTKIWNAKRTESANNWMPAWLGDQKYNFKRLLQTPKIFAQKKIHTV